jgi:hypothetical protein
MYKINGCLFNLALTIKGFVASTRSVHMNFAESEKNVLGGSTRAIKISRGTSRLLNTLEGGLCERSTEK